MSSQPPIRPPLSPEEVGPQTFTTPAYREPAEVTDARHLQLLSVFYYVLAAITVVFSLFAVIYMVAGIIMMASVPMSSRPSGPGAPPPEMMQLMGGMFALMSVFGLLYGLTMAAFFFSGARCLARRTRYTWCLIVAGFACLQMPLGTILGVFTILVLVRPTVKNLFEVASASVVAEAGEADKKA